MCYKRMRQTAGVSSYDDNGRGYLADSAGLALFCVWVSSIFSCGCGFVSAGSLVLAYIYCLRGCPFTYIDNLGEEVNSMLSVLFSPESLPANVAITNEMLQPLVDGVTANIGVILPVGIGLMAIFIGIALIPKLIKKFTKT